MSPGAMSRCEECSGLIGQSPSLPPHAHLKQLSGRKLPNAWQEYYQCAVCGTTLKRLVPFPGFEGRVGEPWSETRRGESGRLTDNPLRRVSGSYTPKRDKTLSYTYEATWVITHTRVIWDSEVKRGGEWKGNPGGNFAMSPDMDVGLTVKRLVGAAIEDLVDVKA